MGHQQAYLAAVDGKHRASKAGQATSAFKVIRGFAIGAGALVAASVFSAAGHAQSAGLFNGLAGVWSGVGKVELDDGSSERIRCRATYAVGAGGNGLNQSLTCASDSYRFELKADAVAQGSDISGTWSESSRGVNGNLKGHGGNGIIQVVASSPGFNANISLNTHGSKQQVVIQADSQFKGATISLTRS
jgi:hypothetical protein